jgi:hypothetical protein
MARVRENKCFVVNAAASEVRLQQQLYHAPGVILQLQIKEEPVEGEQPASSAEDAESSSPGELGRHLR